MGGVVPINLLHDAWLPVRDSAGLVRRVRVAEVGSDGLAALHWFRPDFDGACHELLIGLLHMAALPADDRAWEQAWEQPLTAESLDAGLNAHAEAFMLDGDGPRFLQDPSARDGREGEIGTLLIDAPGENTVKHNLDFFQKRDRVAGICPHCAAMALYTLQAFAPEGGSGHLTSLRAGGPLATLVVDEGNLWRTLWANVLPRRSRGGLGFDSGLPRLGDPWAPADEPVFPWMAALPRNSEKGEILRPGQAPPLQMFFGMPRRIWLDFEDTVVGTCDLCGTESETLVRRYFTKTNGIKYADDWRHPLSPYMHDPRKKTIWARRGRPEGVDYRDWLGLVEAPEVHDKTPKRPHTVPARAVVAHRRRTKGTARLRVYGYDTDNMKARSWNEGLMPVYPQARDHDRLVTIVGMLVAGADEAGNILVHNVKSAWFKRPAEAGGDWSVLRGRLLNRTETAFYELLKALQEADQGDGLGADLSAEQREAWRRTLARTALELFDEAVAAVPVETGGPVRQVALARRALLGNLHGRRLKKALGLDATKAAA